MSLADPRYISTQGPNVLTLPDPLNVPGSTLIIRNDGPAPLYRAANPSEPPTVSVVVPGPLGTLRVDTEVVVRVVRGQWVLVDDVLEQGIAK